MAEIIPSINVNDFQELERRVRLVEPFARWAHIDVSDGVFTKHVNWHDPRELVGFKTSIKLEVHLMIAHPEKEMHQWTIVPADRIIFHQESTEAHQLLIQKIHDAKKEAGIAIKPDTPWLKLFPYFDRADMLQLLAVNPGPSGQNFQEEILHKIGHIRSLCRGCIIEIDGGVNAVVARRCARAGADLLVTGKAIFENDDISKAIEKLKNATHREKFLEHLPGKSSIIAV